MKLDSFYISRFLIFVILGTGSLRSNFVFAETLTLDSAIKTALKSNPEISEYEARAKAQHEAVSSQSFLDNPKFGLSQEKNMNFMEQQMGPMNLWSVSQEIKFPTKYFILYDVQQSKANGASEEANAKKLEVRRKLISAYYSLFSSERIVALLEAQRETLREIARISESRHAMGSSPQQDEMKAHVEQTKIENDILTAKEERTSMEAMLNSILNQEAEEPISLPKIDLPVPALKVTPEQIPGLTHASAKHIKHGQFMIDEAQSNLKLAKWSYAPDFNVSFKKAYTTAPQDNYFIGVEFTIPVWFFEKQASEVGQARANLTATQSSLQKTIRETHAEVRSLTSKVQTHQQLLKIYETSLIPQALSTLNSSRTSYRAGRSSFSDLLDSERSLYSVKIAYYQTLSQYAENLSRLEEMVGQSLSTLPYGENL